MKISLIFVFISILLTFSSQKGKTYDDLEEILRSESDGKLGTRKTHVTAVPTQPEAIDKSQVQKAPAPPPPKKKVEKILTSSGYSIP